MMVWELSARHGHICIPQSGGEKTSGMKRQRTEQPWETVLGTGASIKQDKETRSIPSMGGRYWSPARIETEKPSNRGASEGAK